MIKHRFVIEFIQKTKMSEDEMCYFAMQLHGFTVNREEVYCQVAFDEPNPCENVAEFLKEAGYNEELIEKVHHRTA